MQKRHAGAVLALAVVVSWLAALAQSSGKADQTPTFRARAQLVLVPVMVNDKSGAHVGNLKKGDFTVRENGVEQKIAVFEEIVTAPQRLRRAKETPTEFSNYIVGESKPGRLTIVTLDTINTPFFDQARAKQDLIKFLSESLPAGEPVALVALTRSGVKVIHDFATDPRVLAAALKKVRGGHPNIEQPDLDALEQLYSDAEDAATAEESYKSELQKMLAFELQSEQDFMQFQRRIAITQTMQGLQQIAQAFAGIPGRKALMWAGAGFPFSMNDPNMRAVQPLFERTWQLLNNANIALYPIDVRGLVDPMFISPAIPRPPGNLTAWQMATQARQMAMHTATLDTMQTFAEMTGGRAFYNRNDLDRSFEEAARDSSSYYMLGYYVDKRSGSKPGWRKLEVKVDTKGARVRARSGFFLTETTEDPAKTKNADIDLALSSPLDYTAISVSVKVKNIAPAGDKQDVELAIKVPAVPGMIDETDGNHLSLEFVAQATDATGKSVHHFARTVEARLKPESLPEVNAGGIVYNGRLILPPGDYTLHVVVRDNIRGRVGSASGPLSVKPVPAAN